MDDLTIRPAKDSDMGFVFDSWIESFRESHAAGPIPMRTYRRVYRECVADVLERPGCQLLIACHTADPEHVFGFICHETGNTDRRSGRQMPVVHYLFVKQPFRRLGLAGELLKAAGINPRDPFLYTYKTATGTDIAKRKRLGANWAPLLVRFPKKTKPEESNEDRDRPIHQGD